MNWMNVERKEKIKCADHQPQNFNMIHIYIVVIGYGCSCQSKYGSLESHKTNIHLESVQNSQQNVPLVCIPASRMVFSRNT